MATNPFEYGAIALDDSFTDRDAEINELATDALNGQDVVVLALGGSARPRSCTAPPSA